jgi:hypothetical protein
MSKGKEESYRWTERQQRRYIKFLIRYREKFELSFREKKISGLFLMLGKAVQDRDSLQCRSHHQKMVQKFGSIEGIINAHANLFVQS